MNSNPIEELRNLKTPVSEQEWESIVHDKRYVKKFGRKTGLSPKGRAALIAGSAVVLLTIPVLISTLSHKTTDTAHDTPPTVQTAAPQQEAATEITKTVSPMTTHPASAPKSEERHQDFPAVSNTTTGAAIHEQSTLTPIAEARIPSNIQPTPTINPVTVTVTTSQQTEATNNNPKHKSSATDSNNKKDKADIVDNQPQTTNNIPDENQPSPEKSQEESESDVDEFFIPTAFTPNGDGLNDLFKVQANFVPNTFEMSIFNRKGELMFLSQDMGISWDGQFHGQTLPSGVYVCIIKYTDRQGNIRKKQGQVMLLP